MENLRFRCCHFSFVLMAFGLILVGCQDAQYDAFRFGPDPGGDKSQETNKVEEIE